MTKKSEEILNTQKLIEYLEQFVTENRRELFNQVLAERTRHFTVVTEDLYQPHNANAVIRSCECFGIQDLHVIEARNEFAVSRGVSQGATKWVDINKHKNAEDCIKQLKAKGYQIVATTPHTNDVLLEDFDVTKKSALFFGTELEGLTNAVLDNADAYMRIPIYGFTESYNISVSAAITLHHLTYKMRANQTINWQLNQQEKQALQLKWLKRSLKNADMYIEKFKAENS